MYSKFQLFVVVCLCVLPLILCEMESAAYRKPPLNGSIFGKRSKGKYYNNYYFVKSFY